MCQAYEGERAMILAFEKAARRRGYEAFKIGKEEPDWHEEYVADWEMGYAIAKNGLRLF